MRTVAAVASQHSQTADKLQSLLARLWGYQSFRPFQRESIEAFIRKQDCFVCLATGAGKSLTFVLPALATGLTCVVVSPLISLMEDQTQRLKSLGIKADYVSEGREDELCQSVIENGDLSVLFVTPEKLTMGFDFALFCSCFANRRLMLCGKGSKSNSQC